MNYYVSYMEAYVKGELVSTGNVGRSLTEEEFMPIEVIKVNWDNLEDFVNKYYGGLPFAVYYKKKGRIISFFNWCFFKTETKDIKEWKHKLDIEIRYYHRKVEASFKDLQYFEAVKVQKYLTERA